MKSLRRSFLLVVAILICLAPVSFAGRPRHDERCRPGRRCQQVPEGGSGVVYLLGAGLTCLGAMVIRSRAAKPSQS